MVNRLHGMRFFAALFEEFYTRKKVRQYHFTNLLKRLVRKCVKAIKLYCPGVSTNSTEPCTDAFGETRGPVAFQCAQEVRDICEPRVVISGTSAYASMLV